MSRLLALLKKELSEHGAVALVAASLMGIILFSLLLGNAFAPRTITVLEGHRSFSRIFLPLFALVVGHRLIVREYHGRTQRFLEALPIRRSEVVVTKYALGLVTLLACGGLSLALFAGVALMKEPITFSWLLLVLTRTELFVAVLWSYFFMMGLLGRWRIPLYLALAIFLLFLQSSTDAEVERFGPFMLVGETMVLERHALPWVAVAECAGLCVGFTVVGVWLALINAGSIAEAMANRMSLREKTAVGIAFAAGFIVLDVVDTKREKPPFAFESDYVIALEDPAVSVLYLDPANRAVGERLAALVAQDLNTLQDRLSGAELPSIHVALRPTLEASRSEVVTLEDSDEQAVLVRAAYTDPEFDRDAFRRLVIEEVLEHVTDGRAAFEPNRWIQRGFAGWLVEHEAGVSEPTLVRSLLVARDRAPRAEDLFRFRRIEESLGQDLASAWAITAMFAVAEATSDEALVEFAVDLVGREPAWGMRAVFDARSAPPLSRLERSTGLDTVDFERAFAAQLAGYGRDPRSARLAEIGDVQGFVTVEPLEGALRQFRWGVTGDGVEALETCRLVHVSLGPFDRVIDETTLSREELPCREVTGAGATLVGRYGTGERVFVAVEVIEPRLGVPWRVYAARILVQ